MKNTEFINSKMIYGHRYAQRFETLTESACYKEDLDRKLTDFAKGIPHVWNIRHEDISSI